MFIAASAAVLVTMILTMIRLFAGPSLYDRTLAGNAFGTCTVLLIGIMGFLTDRPDFMDIAVLKFFRYRALGDVPDRAGKKGP